MQTGESNLTPYDQDQRDPYAFIKSYCPDPNVWRQFQFKVVKIMHNMQSENSLAMQIAECFRNAAVQKNPATSFSILKCLSTFFDRGINPFVVNILLFDFSKTKFLNLWFNNLKTEQGTVYTERESFWNPHTRYCDVLWQKNENDNYLLRSVIRPDIKSKIKYDSVADVVILGVKIEDYMTFEQSEELKNYIDETFNLDTTILVLVVEYKNDNKEFFEGFAKYLANYVNSSFCICGLMSNQHLYDVLSNLLYRIVKNLAIVDRDEISRFDASKALRQELLTYYFRPKKDQKYCDAIAKSYGHWEKILGRDGYLYNYFCDETVSVINKDLFIRRTKDARSPFFILRGAISQNYNEAFVEQSKNIARQENSVNANLTTVKDSLHLNRLALDFCYQHALQYQKTMPVISLLIPGAYGQQKDEDGVFQVHSFVDGLCGCFRFVMHHPCCIRHSDVHEYHIDLLPKESAEVSKQIEEDLKTSICILPIDLPSGFSNSKDSEHVAKIIKYVRVNNKREVVFILVGIAEPETNFQDIGFGQIRLQQFAKEQHVDFCLFINIMNPYNSPYYKVLWGMIRQISNQIIAGYCHEHDEKIKHRLEVINKGFNTFLDCQKKWLQNIKKANYSSYVEVVVAVFKQCFEDNRYDETLALIARRMPDYYEYGLFVWMVVELLLYYVSDDDFKLATDKLGFNMIDVDFFI